MFNEYFNYVRDHKSQTRARELGLRVYKTFLRTKKVETAFFAQKRLLPKSLCVKKPTSLNAFST